MNITEQEKKLAIQYVTGAINEPQFNWWICEFGLDKDRMYEIAHRSKPNNVNPMLLFMAIASLFLLASACLVVISELRDLR